MALQEDAGHMPPNAMKATPPAATGATPPELESAPMMANVTATIQAVMAMAAGISDQQSHLFVIICSYLFL